ncbi:MAG: type II toxin-antitoxin system VapC family toxin [Rhodanobacteraceae bacterium]
MAVAVLREMMAADRACLSPVVYQEILQGANSPGHFERLRRYFSAEPMLVPKHPVRSHEAAARLYAHCRWHGVTPRSRQGCCVAQTAIEHGVELLAYDRDFEAIASVEPRLRLYRHTEVRP